MIRDLVDRLSAVLDEEERLAMAASTGWSRAAEFDEGGFGGAQFAHIDRQDPDRTLRRVAAHRRILDLHQRSRDNVADRLGFTAPDMCVIDAETWPCQTVREALSMYRGQEAE